MIATCTKCIERYFSKSNLLVNLYGLYYKSVVRNEVNLAKINSSDRVLCIGGGPIPSTAIEIVKQTDAKVHVIDMDSEAVAYAKKVVKKLGLDHKIVVDQARGEEVDILPYNVIHVALQVSPKEDVLNHIWNSCKAGAKIIVRMPKKGLRHFYSSVTEGFVDRYSDYIRFSSQRFRANTMDKILIMVKG